MEHEEEERSLRDYVFLGARAAIAIALILVGKLWLTEENYPWYVNLIVMGLAYIVVAYDIFIKAIKNAFIEHEFFDECTLMIVASLGAFAIRAFGPEHNEYLEGVLVMLLYQIGELFEDLAADKSRDAITKAIDLREEKAKVITKQGIVEKHADDLQVGDVIMVGAGMKILADGDIVEGSGEIDESSLTGEFNPVSKSIGARVNSGSLLSSGSIKVEVKRAYEDSTVAKLLDLIENSSERKSKSTRFIDRFSRIYAPVVTGLAVLIAVLPPLFIGIGDGSVWARWLYSALS
ncbi:MAG: HAD-IC family P-type ATPase, partial [Bacilli bacterium]|nr:HAD-IC family P-type ATPase [Bacilli bacterium]